MKTKAMILLLATLCIGSVMRVQAQGLTIEVRDKMPRTLCDRHCIPYNVMNYDDRDLLPKRYVPHRLAPSTMPSDEDMKRVVKRCGCLE